VAPPPDAARFAVRRADGVLAADYGRGTLASAAVRELVAQAVRSGVPTVWDPHPRGAPPVPGVTLAVPNAAEAARFDDVAASDQTTAGALRVACDRARRLRAQWGAQAVAVTLGAGGAAVSTGAGVPLVIPIAEPVRGGDTCGAGDAFASAAALRLAQRAVVSEAVVDAVHAAARFVADGGASGLATAERSSTEPTEAPAGELVVAGGCFDMLHAGHVAMLESARALGDRLVVLLNDDGSVRRLKGPGRPVQGVEDRAAMLRSLRCVDDVVVFDTDTPEGALRRLRPAVFVKGGDYTSTELPECAVLAEWGGVVVTAPYLAGRSTSGLIQQIGGH
jgi:rfaE bifunctional protein nucleotidyltransferase chain/domain